MYQIEVPFDKRTLQIAAGILIIFALGGYILYFQASSAASHAHKEIKLLEEKSKASENDRSTLQKASDTQSAALQQLQAQCDTITKEAEACAMEKANLQAQYESLQQVNQTLKESLQTPHTEITTPPTEPTTPSASSDTAPTVVPTPPTATQGTDTLQEVPLQTESNN